MNENNPATQELGIYAEIPRAAANILIEAFQTGDPQTMAYRQDLINRLDIYERSFAQTYVKRPETLEGIAHHHAMVDSGFTEVGLCTARGYAGKIPSMKPGVFFPIDTLAMGRSVQT